MDIGPSLVRGSGRPESRKQLRHRQPGHRVRHAPATCASGSSTKRRSRKRGCGTTSPGSSTIRVPEQDEVEVEGARGAAVRPLAPALALDGQQAGEQRRAEGRRRPDHRRVQERALFADDVDRRRFEAGRDKRMARNSRRRATAKSRCAARSPRLLPRATATRRGRHSTQRVGRTAPGVGDRRSGGRCMSSSPAAAWWNKRDCSSVSPSIKSSISLWRACVISATRGRQAATKPSMASASARARRRTASSSFADRRDSGTRVAGHRAAHVRGSHPPSQHQVLVFARDHVLVGVVDVVLPGHAGHRHVAAPERRLAA